MTRNSRSIARNYHYTDTYRYVNQVPFRDGADVLIPKITYKNNFATNHTITESNVTDIVRDGRACWKVKNENNNNTLKIKV